MLKNWWMEPGVTALKQKLYGDKEGYHATPSEVAVTWYAFPDAQRDGKLDPIGPADRTYQGPADFRPRHPDGRMGADPSPAPAAHGRQLVHVATTDLPAASQAFLRMETRAVGNEVVSTVKSQ